MPVGSGTPQEQVFSFVVPIDVVDLPSGGKYYPSNHPLHGVSTVEIKHMTAKEEDILANKSFLEKGLALDKLLESLFVNKAIDPKSLLLTDKNAILIQARISGYGPEYGASVICPKCSVRADIEVDLNNLLQIEEPQLEDGSRLLDNGLVEILLPKTGWVVAVKPLSTNDQEKLEKLIEGRKKHNIETNAIVETMKSFICSVNGISDDAAIYQALNAIPALDSRYLRSVYAKCFPRAKTETDLICTSCGSDSVVEVPFTINFFWPN
jgi:hypothetical protein